MVSFFEKKDIMNSRKIVSKNAQAFMLQREKNSLVLFLYIYNCKSNNITQNKKS